MRNKTWSCRIATIQPSKGNHVFSLGAAINSVPKSIYWTSGIQFDFYDGKQVDEAIDQIDFFFHQ
jgi:hypothetical protein